MTKFKNIGAMPLLILLKISSLFCSLKSSELRSNLSQHVHTSIEVPISEWRSRAFCKTLKTSGGGACRFIISITPPVKSCSASLIRPNPMAS